MRISFVNNTMVIEDDQVTIDKLKQVNDHWPKLLPEYLDMIIRNRERQLKRIEVTQELNIKERGKK